MTAEDFKTFVAMDDNLEIAGDPSNEEPLEAVAQGSRDEQSEESEDDADIHQNLTIPMKMKMVKTCVNLLKKIRCSMLSLYSTRLRLKCLHK